MFFVGRTLLEVDELDFLGLPLLLLLELNLVLRDAGDIGGLVGVVFLGLFLVVVLREAGEIGGLVGLVVLEETCRPPKPRISILSFSFC